MAASTLTIDPEDVRAVAAKAGDAAPWLERVARYVRAAAAEGETVTLTSRRRMLTPEQVADRLGVSRSTISRRIKEGRLRAVKVGNRNRVPYEEFERFRYQMMGDLVELSAEEIRADLFGE